MRCAKSGAASADSACETTCVVCNMLCVVCVTLSPAEAAGETAGGAGAARRPGSGRGQQLGLPRRRAVTAAQQQRRQQRNTGTAGDLCVPLCRARMQAYASVFIRSRQGSIYGDCRLYRRASLSAPKTGAGQRSGGAAQGGEHPGTPKGGAAERKERERDIIISLGNYKLTLCEQLP